MSLQILLIEDNELNRDMLSRRLTRRGHTVTLASDGVEGVAAALASPPDVVLLDMSLPKLDGWTVATRLRSHVETAHTRIIALTAHAMSGDREKAIRAGCDDYDTKPVDFERLMVKISGSPQ